MLVGLEAAFLDTGTEIGQLILARDWSGTPLGPIRDWPAELRATIRLISGSRQPILTAWGSDLVVLYNDALTMILGDKHPSCLGTPMREMFAEEWAVLGAMLEGVLAGAAPFWIEDQLLMLNRHVFAEEGYFTYSVSGIRGADGRVGGLFTPVSDTTFRVVAERRLSTLRALGGISAVGQRSAAQAVAAAVDVLRANPLDVPAAAVYLFDDGDEASLVAHYGMRVGTPALPTRLSREHPSGLAEPLLRTGEPAVVDDVPRHHPGVFTAVEGTLSDTAPSRVVALPLAAPGQASPIGALLLAASPHRVLDEDYRTFLDLVTGHVTTAVADVRAYESERRRAETLAELDRAKTEFFTNVSHELRTPLTLITGPIEELRGSAEVAADPALREAADAVRRNGLRLAKLVDSLLDFSQLQAGRMQPVPEPVALSTLTADLASSFRSAAEASGLRLVVHCDPLPVPVPVDPTMWEQVVLNLLSNAVKFTLRGSIEVSLCAEGQSAVLTVQDTGCGIPADQLDRVFERFRRVRGATARSHEGSGIGLALVNELVKLHAGGVEVRSTVDVGTAVTVRIPLGGPPTTDHGADRTRPPVSAPAARTAPGSGTRAEAFVAEATGWTEAAEPVRVEPGPTGVESEPVSGGRVLVVDDNADMRSYLRRLLAAQHEVQVAADGATALAIATADPPDLVISDVMMPGLSGFELLDALRADPSTAHVPVLMVSARAGPGASAEALGTGADDYLCKPFSAAELRARVQAHLRLSRWRRSVGHLEELAVLGPAMMWADDQDGRRHYLNPGWFRFCGASPSELLGQGWLDRMHPTDRQTYRDQVAAARAAGQGWEIEFRLRRSDGEYRWLLEHGVPLASATGATGHERPDVRGWVGSCVDITERARRAERERRATAERLARSEREIRLTERQLHDERQRYNALVAQARLGVFLTDTDDRIVFANEYVGMLLRRPVDELIGHRWAEYLHPEDASRQGAGWAAARAAERRWSADHRLLDATGTAVHVRSSAYPLHDRDGRLTGFLGATIEATEQRASSHSPCGSAGADGVTDAATVRRQATARKPIAVVWAARPADMSFTFVSDQAAQLLGYPVQRWLDRPRFWPVLVHPADRDRVARARATYAAAGHDHTLSYRAVCADGRTVWLHDVARVVHDDAGAPDQLHGVMIDVTVQRRAERWAQLLVEADRRLGGPGTPEQRLAGAAGLLTPEFGGAALVAMVGTDGLLRQVAVAAQDRALRKSIGDLAPRVSSSAVKELLRTRRPVTVPVTDLSEAVRAGEAVPDDDTLAARDALGAFPDALLVPIATGESLVGILALPRAGTCPRPDDAELDLVEQLSHRMATMIQAERQQTRDRAVQRVGADLAAASSAPEAAERLLAHIDQVLGIDTAAVYAFEPHRGLRLVHATGRAYREHEAIIPLTLDGQLPHATVAATGQPVWIADPAEVGHRYPRLRPADDAHPPSGIAVLPIRAGGRLVGVLVLRLPASQDFDPHERTFIDALVAQAAPAFERAADADAQRRIADILQHSLLPGDLPKLESVELAARYVPGAEYMQAGGDWYDVFELPGGLIAIAVGDVVGQGAHAAAVMGQLRSALAAYLLDGHSPVVALERLDGFARRVEGATGSTVACLLLDPRTGRLDWARAGHPPPLLIGASATRYLARAHGAPLGARDRPPFTPGHAVLAAGDAVLLYTDGLIERRAEPLELGLARLADTAAALCEHPPTVLVEHLLHQAQIDNGPPDDIAIICAKLNPPGRPPPPA